MVYRASTLFFEYLLKDNLNFIATLDKELAYKDSDYIVISTPTDYVTVNNHFDTSSIESVLNDIKDINPNVPVIIKSTVPVGYTRALRKKVFLYLL